MLAFARSCVGEVSRVVMTTVDTTITKEEEAQCAAICTDIGAEYQALMRLCGDYRRIKDEIYEKSLSHATPKVLVYVEENPSNLS